MNLTDCCIHQSARRAVCNITYKFFAAQDPDEAPGDWEIEFTAKAVSDDNPTWSVTGTGNSAEVFGTVVDIIRAFLKEKKGDVRRTIGKGKNFNKAKSTGTGADAGGGMTQKGVNEYKRKNPGSKLKTAVTGDVKPGSKDAKRRKSFCARSKGWTGERGKAARRRWKC